MAEPSPNDPTPQPLDYVGRPQSDPRPAPVTETRCVFGATAFVLSLFTLAGSIGLLVNSREGGFGGAGAAAVLGCGTLLLFAAALFFTFIALGSKPCRTDAITSAAILAAALCIYLCMQWSV